MGKCEDYMTNAENLNTAREVINQFFLSLEAINGMDNETATVIQKLWNEDNLGKDELLSKLEALRDKEGQHGEEEA